MEYEVLVGYCAGIINENARSGIFDDKKKGFYDEKSVSKLTNYFLFIEFERDVFQFLKDVGSLLMEISDMYDFDDYRGLIVYDYSLLRKDRNKYKGFDNLLSLCLGDIDVTSSEAFEIGADAVVYYYSDFKKQFPEEFERFDFVGEYNFMELLNQYINYEMPSSIRDITYFDDETGSITVDFRLLKFK